MIGYTKEFVDLDQIWARAPKSIAPTDPSGAGNWEQIDDRILQLKELVLKFREDVNEHIVGNKEPTPYDWIQHRFCLHHLLADLDEAFLAASRAPRDTEIDRNHLAKVLSALDSLHTPLYREFIEWHGKLEDQTDIPPDLIRAFQEADAGKTIDFEKALSDAPPEAD